MFDCLKLEPDSALAAGSGRMIFMVEGTDSIIKILRPDLRNKIFRKRFKYLSVFLYRDQIINYRELSEILKFAGVNGTIPEFVAEFRGLKNTNYGVGALFEKISDFSGTLSKPLNHYVGRVHCDSLRAKVDEFCDNVLKSGLLVGDLNLSNVLVQWTQERGCRLVLIDGLGGTEFIQLRALIPWFRRISMKKKVREFKAEFERLALTGAMPTAATDQSGVDPKV